jgi:hypothetical protein
MKTSNCFPDIKVACNKDASLMTRCKSYLFCLFAFVLLNGTIARAAQPGFPLPPRGTVEIECTIDTLLRYSSTPRLEADRSVDRFRLDLRRKKIAYGRLEAGTWRFTVSGQQGTDWAPNRTSRPLQGDLFVIERSEHRFIAIDLANGTYIQTDRHPTLPQLAPYGRFGYCTRV